MQTFGRINEKYIGTSVAVEAGYENNISQPGTHSVYFFLKILFYRPPGFQNRIHWGRV